MSIPRNYLRIMGVCKPGLLSFTILRKIPRVSTIEYAKWPCGFSNLDA